MKSDLSDYLVFAAMTLAGGAVFWLMVVF